MRPFVLITIEGGQVEDTTVVGDCEVSPIIVDWDDLDLDHIEAMERIQEINGQFSPGEEPPKNVQATLARLQEIVDEADDEFDDEDDDEFDDDDDDEGVFDDDEFDDDDSNGGSSTISTTTFEAEAPSRGVQGLIPC